jgi:hypothetical protein
LIIYFEEKTLMKTCFIVFPAKSPVLCIGSPKNKFNVGNLFRLNCFLCSFVPSKEPKPRAGNDFVTRKLLEIYPASFTKNK